MSETEELSDMSDFVESFFEITWWLALTMFDIKHIRAPL